MKTVKEWASAFKVSGEQYALWMREAPKGESFTFWCLRSGKLNEDDYIGWAREFYGLASLHTQYFHQPLNPNLWHKIHSVANWSAEMLPIAEWDGVIFIGCVEPNRELSWSFPVQYVLAKARDLKKIWQSLVPNVPLEQPPMDERSFVGIPPTPDKQTSNTLHLDVSISRTGMRTAPPLQPVPPPRPPQAEELREAPPAHSITSIKLDGSIDAGSPAASGTSHVSDEPSIIDEPLGLNLNLAKNSANKDRDFMAELANSVLGPTTAAPTAAPNLDDELTMAPEGFKLPPQPQAAAKPVAAQAAAKPTAPPRPPPTASHAAAPVSPIASAPQPTAPPQPKAPPPIPGSAPGAPMAGTGGSPQMNPLYVKFLTRISSVFGGGMIIEINRDNFIPVVWDEAFRPTGDNARRVWNLNPPSAFRIAYRTGQPYIGHVVETPTNNEFFSAWGFVSMPKSILVQPVKNSEEVVTHLLLCLSDGIRKNHQVLSEGERLGTDFAELAQRQAAA
jgi:hypothetical protein